VAREAFGVADEALLSAIARHTVGGERMTLDEQILFVADAIEPGRGEAVWLADIRAAAEVDLALACRRAYDHTFEFLLRHGQPIHPDAARGRNWLLHQERVRSRTVVPEPTPEAPRLG
jgi:predicted HD superfamily hydrolase involved in NAD metabolism